MASLRSLSLSERRRPTRGASPSCDGAAASIVAAAGGGGGAAAAATAAAGGAVDVDNDAVGGVVTVAGGGVVTVVGTVADCGGYSCGVSAVAPDTAKADAPSITDAAAAAAAAGDLCDVGGVDGGMRPSLASCLSSAKGDVSRGESSRISGELCRWRKGG